MWGRGSGDEGAAEARFTLPQFRALHEQLNKNRQAAAFNEVRPVYQWLGLIWHGLM
jgi:hypothetical protein